MFFPMCSWFAAHQNELLHVAAQVLNHVPEDGIVLRDLFINVEFVVPDGLLQGHVVLLQLPGDVLHVLL